MNEAKKKPFDEVVKDHRRRWKKAVEEMAATAEAYRQATERAHDVMDEYREERSRYRVEAAAEGRAFDEHTAALTGDLCTREVIVETGETVWILDAMAPTYESQL